MAINEGRDRENEQFNAKLNIDQVTDTLTSLRLAYKEARDVAFRAYNLLKDEPGFSIGILNHFGEIFYISPNEPEFLAYDLIIQLQNERNFLEIHQRIMGFSTEILAADEMKFAIKVVTAVKENNFVEYFKLLEQADYLTSCMMSAFIKMIREKAINAMERSQARSNIESISLNRIYELLAFEDMEEAYSFLKFYPLVEVPQEMETDDIIGGEEGPFFKLMKVKIEGDEAKLEARKKFIAIKPAMNTRIIEDKREIKNFKEYQNEKNIHYNNTQVPRRFIVQGLWKFPSSKYLLKVMSNMLKIRFDTTHEPKLITASVPDYEVPEIESLSNKLIRKKSSADLTLLGRRASEARKELIGEIPEEEDVDAEGELTVKEQKQLKDLEKEQEEQKLKHISEQKRAELIKKQKLEAEEIRIAKEAERKRREQIEKERQELINYSAKRTFKILNRVLKKTQKELIGHLEATLDYERDLSSFRKAILENSIEYGLNSSRLVFATQERDVSFIEEEDKHAFFSFLAVSLAEQEPDLDRYCYKAVIFHPLFKDIHFELFRYIIRFFTDNQERLEEFEFDQIPTLYESKNIEFEIENELKKLWVCFKVYDENFLAQNEQKDPEEDDSDSVNSPKFVPPSDVLSANMVIFVVTGDKKVDKERFEPVYNAIIGKKHSETVNVLFLHLSELRLDKAEKKNKKQEIIENLKLHALYEKGLQPYFIKIPYFVDYEVESRRYNFKNMNYILHDKLTAVMKQGIEDQVSVKVPCFYTLRDLAEKLKNGLEEMEFLNIEYESTSLEAMAKIFHESMSENSIEAYYYVKNFLSHAVDSIKLNFDFWHERLDQVAPEFLENYNQAAFEKIRDAKQDFDAILEKMFKINDFDERYWRRLQAIPKARVDYDTVYGLIERKVQKVFQSRKKEIRLDEILQILTKNFKFNSAIGMS